MFKSVQNSFDGDVVALGLGWCDSDWVCSRSGGFQCEFGDGRFVNDGPEPNAVPCGSELLDVCAVERIEVGDQIIMRYDDFLQEYTHFGDLGDGSAISCPDRVEGPVVVVREAIT